MEFAFLCEVTKFSYPAIRRFFLAFGTMCELLTPYMAISTRVTAFTKFTDDDVRVAKFNVR